jgi:y4mF family transcriptional regulator
MTQDIPVSGAKDIGKIIRHYRYTHKLTQTALADMANVSSVFINEVEGGKPTAQIGLILSVLQVLGVDLVARPR